MFKYSSVYELTDTFSKPILIANEMSSQISVMQNLILNYFMNYVDALNLVKTEKCDRAMYWI